MTTKKQGARTLVAVAVMMLTALLAAHAGEPPIFPALAPDGEPLRAAFNRDAGRVRLLFFIDPT